MIWGGVQHLPAPEPVAVDLFALVDVHLEDLGLVDLATVVKAEHQIPRLQLVNPSLTAAIPAGVTVYGSFAVTSASFPNYATSAAVFASFVNSIGAGAIQYRSRNARLMEDQICPCEEPCLRQCQIIGIV